MFGIEFRSAAADGTALGRAAQSAKVYVAPVWMGMNARSIGEVPRSLLYHRLNRTLRVGWPQNVEVTTYAQFPINMRRPPEGAVSGQVYCGICKQNIWVTVYSVLLTRKRRRHRLWVVWAGLTLIAAAIVMAIYRAGGIRPLNGAVSVILGIAGLVATIFGLIYWTNEDGVRLGKSGLRKKDDRHVINSAPERRAPAGFRPVGMRKPPAQVEGAAAFIFLLAMALLTDAVSRIVAGAGPVSAPVAIVGGLCSVLTAVGLWLGGRPFIGLAVFLALIFLWSGWANRTAHGWGPVGLIVAALWAVTILLVTVPKSSRAWFRPTRRSA